MHKRLFNFYWATRTAQSTAKLTDKVREKLIFVIKDLIYVGLLLRMELAADSNDSQSRAAFSKKAAEGMY